MAWREFTGKYDTPVITVRKDTLYICDHACKVFLLSGANYCTFFVDSKKYKVGMQFTCGELKQAKKEYKAHHYKNGGGVYICARELIKTMKLAGRYTLVKSAEPVTVEFTYYTPRND